MLKIKIPIKTVSEANSREHWSKRHRRATAQKKAVKYILGHHIMQNAPELLKMRPEDLLIKITRIAPRKLDYDNLCCSQKQISDSVCNLLNPGLAPGRADANYKIEYYQERGETREYATQIEIVRICSD